MSDGLLLFSFLCRFSSGTFFSTIFAAYIHFAAGHLHDTNKAPCLCWLDFPLFSIFYASFDLTQKIWAKKRHARARLHIRNNQIDGWKLKDIMNIWLVLKFDWKWVERLTSYQNTKFPEKKRACFPLSPSASWRFFAVFLVLFCLFHFWWNTFNNWPNHNRHDCSAKDSEKLKMPIKSWLEFSI